MEKKPFQVGLIRVLTSDDQHFVDMHGQIIMDHFPGIQVESRCIPDQWEGIHSHELELIAVPKIVELAKTFQALPHMSVTGGGETTVALAGKYGDKIGLLGITDYAPRAYRKLPKDRLVAVEKPEGVNSTLDLMTDEGRKNCVACARKIKDMGADVIALGCTGLTTIGIAKLLEQEVGLPVIDPVLAEGLFAFFESIRK